MQAAGHCSLLIIAKNLYNPKKRAETSNNEILNGASKIHAVVITIITHIMKFLSIIKNPCGRKQETSNQLCLALYNLFNQTYWVHSYHVRGGYIDIRTHTNTYRHISTHIWTHTHAHTRTHKHTHTQYSLHIKVEALCVMHNQLVNYQCQALKPPQYCPSYQLTLNNYYTNL